jgi:hypothetical protein
VVERDVEIACMHAAHILLQKVNNANLVANYIIVLIIEFFQNRIEPSMQDPDSELLASVPSSSTASSSQTVSTSSFTLSGEDLSAESLTTPCVEGQIDLGSVVEGANGSWERLRALVTKINDDKKKTVSHTSF